MSKVADNYAQLAAATGLHADGTVIYGERGGYPMIAVAADSRYPYLLTVHVSAKPTTGIYFSKDDLKQFAKDNKPVMSLTQQGNSLAMVVKNTPKLENLKEVLNEALNALAAYLNSKSYEACCQFCSQPTATQAYEIGTGYMQICPECVARLRQDVTLSLQQKAEKKENLIGGIVGALLGTALGILCIIFFSQLGRIAAISGFVMAVCTLKGYEMLGGKLTKKGMVISIVLMLIMTYVGDRLDWAIMIVREWELDFVTSFAIVPDLLAEGYIESGNYWYNLILLYVFTVLGAVPTIKSVMNEQKSSGNIRPIGGVDNSNMNM